MEINAGGARQGWFSKKPPFRDGIRDNYHGVGNFRARLHIIFQPLSAYTHIHTYYIRIFFSHERRVFKKEQKGSGSLGIDVGLKRTEGKEENETASYTFPHQLTKVFSLVVRCRFILSHRLLVNIINDTRN